MTKYIIHYVLTFAAFFAIDLVWLGVVAKNFYRAQLGHLMADKVNWPAAIIFYLLFVLGVMIFAVYPGVAKSSLKYALLFGALFGFFAYATYDLTNLATLKDWPLTMVVVDIIWGSVLACVVAGAGYWVVTHL